MIKKASLKYASTVFKGGKKNVNMRFSALNEQDGAIQLVVGTIHTHRDNSLPSGLGSNEVPTNDYDVGLIQTTQVPAYILGPQRTFVGIPGTGSPISPGYRVTAPPVKYPNNLLLDLLTKSK